MGSIYKRGKTWWIKYYINSRPIYESSKSEKHTEAKRLLSLREGKIVEGKLPNPKIEKTSFEDLSRIFLNDYQINQKKSVVEAQRSVVHLRTHFGRLRAIDITPSRIQAYIASRSPQVENSTINRELSALKRMFSLGLQQELVLSAPRISLLREDNVRTGFFTHDEFLTLRGKAPDHLKIACSIAYWTGLRTEEILSLKWEDIKEGFIIKAPGTTKNRKGRHIPLMGDLQNVLDKWRLVTLNSPCPFIVQYKNKPVRSLKTAWKTVCKRSGIQRHFHDFRRTAVRNMVRAGIPERVVMEISGHRTRSVFDRYNIVSEADLKEAARRMTVTDLVTIPDPS